MRPKLPRFVVADTHLGLEDAGYRPGDADALIGTAWRRLVRPEDEVWHLGDVALASDSYRRRNRDLLASLPGRVTLLPGNWDEVGVIEMCRALGWQVQRGPVDVLIGDRVVSFSHYPEETPLGEAAWNVHGHLHRPAPPPYEPSERHLNVAAALHDWSPVELLPLLRSRGLELADEWQ